eukprot:TRINITY_DN1391_c0_g1_i3.p1 TRINITY_DN1391_c0_g1~~TRINITY_DN1391_c0_g1_i3.p1  ORF type:complete len:483 (-),score=83.54 TRINITY_DN1391_c0_g1_i3:222-1601(-)
MAAGGCFQSRQGTRAMALVATAVILASCCQAFLSASPQLRSRTSTGNLAGSTGPSARPSHLQPSQVSMAAGEEIEISIGVSGLWLQLALALLPTLVIELIVESEKSRPRTREYVLNSEDQISIQIPFQIGNWEAARQNPDRVWKTLAGLLDSSLLRRLQGSLFVLNAVSAFVLFYTVLLVPQGYPLISLQTLPFTLSSFALGLLLAYRANQATLRYIKARDIWGDMLNICRDLTQMSSQWARYEDFVDFARWVPAFPASLMYALRNPEAHDLAQELREAAGPDLSKTGAGAGLSEEEIQLIVNRPKGMLAHHYVTHILRTKIKLMDLPLEQRALMENNITRLINDCGACENIFATPIPVAYSKHTTTFLYLWLFFLPWALEGSLGVGVVFAQQLLSFFLLGIEDIGVQIEQPFDVLPLKKICFKISNEGQIVRSNFASLEEAARVSRKAGVKQADPVPA